MIVLNLVVVNFPCVPVQLCLMNIQIDTPHTPEGFFCCCFFLFVFGTLERLLSFFFRSIFEFSDGEIAVIITTTAHTHTKHHQKVLKYLNFHWETAAVT